MSLFELVRMASRMDVAPEQVDAMFKGLIAEVKKEYEDQDRRFEMKNSDLERTYSL